MRVLGVDWGSKRIGTAVGESEFGVATPRPNLAASGSLDRDAAAIVALAREEGASLIVVGIPEGHDDARQSRLCHLLADQIQAFGVEVARVDESLTSVEAEGLLRESADTAAQRRKLVDGAAACEILLRYFASPA